MTFLSMTNPSIAMSFRPEVALRGPLDTTAVNHLLDRIAQAPEANQLTVDCSAVSSVDPVGTARLWVLARELELAGRMLRIIGLPERFIRRLRLHPLLRFVEQEDAVFTDPFAVAGSSR
jgi:ABC-type transporter Mla MlaB component